MRDHVGKAANACCYRIDLCGRRGSPDLWFNSWVEATPKRPGGMLNAEGRRGVWVKIP